MPKYKELLKTRAGNAATLEDGFLMYDPISIVQSHVLQHFKKRKVKDRVVITKSVCSICYYSWFYFHLSFHFSQVCHGAML